MPSPQASPAQPSLARRAAGPGAALRTHRAVHSPSHAAQLSVSAAFGPGVRPRCTADLRAEPGVFRDPKARPKTVGG